MPAASYCQQKGANGSLRAHTLQSSEQKHVGLPPWRVLLGGCLLKLPQPLERVPPAGGRAFTHRSLQASISHSNRFKGSAPT